MEQKDSKKGDRIAVFWKNQDSSALGGTEGYMVGRVGDKVSGEFLVIDRSTYQDSLKAALFSLGIFDFRTVPLQDIEAINRLDLRERPPGVSESLKWYIEIDYKSNIDYNETHRKLGQRTDCKVNPNNPPQTDGTCGITVLEMAGVERAKVVISPKGFVQIFCAPNRLDDCIKWIEGAVEIWPDHKRLFLIPTNFKFSINDMYKGLAYPTGEEIDGLAKTGGTQSIIFPLGWVHQFFGERKENLLQGRFSNAESVESLLLAHEEKRQTDSKNQVGPDKMESKQSVNLDFPYEQKAANMHLGAEAPIFRIFGDIKSPEEESALLKMWMESRSDIWQWFESPQLSGKMLIHNLTIDRKTHSYTLEMQRYSENEL
jgi:hypothetical protein